MQRHAVRVAVGGSVRAGCLLYWCEHHRSASYLADIPDHQDRLVWYPEVDRRRSVVKVESQFGEDMVA